ncbi:MAG TPA: M48 family metallopeptidase [Noviherbaspirillum sp.]|uniref:M48 family metallopeptidase n=1 Tax=Noviherbaspirillum sp. TaxID=1926288 RepID=UPI002B470521|nr:M48 family metallopeptidase [Noviherbaspirillum sp.]HJV87301.1 M48 family metallopeptidase [Noviherbaspirillum sp.]
MNRLLLAPFFIAACFFGMHPAHAQDRVNEADGGVKVGKPSALRKLVPEDQVEASALQQYTEVKQQANRKGALVPASDPQVARLRAIARNIIPHTTRWNERATQWQWEVNLIASSEVNAFCMPGGKIAFYTGLLDTLKLTDDEVAIVMGHEIAHALREHGRERMAKGTLLNLGTALGSALLGLKDTGQMLAGQGAKLVMLKFSRSDETEADLVGLDIAARAGYDPRAGIALWQKMGMVSKNAPPQWLSTHPAGGSRIADMQQHLPEVMPLYANAKGTTVDALPPYRSNAKGIASIR